MDLRFWRRKPKPLNVQEELQNIRLRWENHRHELGLQDAPQAAVRPLRISSSRIITRIRQTVSKFVSQIYRNTYEEPEWNFEEVDRAIQKESLLRRAIEKYVEQIWKNGFEFVGKNPNTVRYIRKRFRQIAQVSGITTLQLFQQIAFSLVAYANVIIVKRRSLKASGGRVRQRFDGKELLPVAAYFVVSPTSIIVDKDQYGNVRRWKQKPSTFFAVSDTPEWGPDNVIFFRDNTATDSQYFFAMPMAIPVIPDIKALRETEELALLQAIKFAIPRYHAKVGERDKPATQIEIDNTAEYLDTLPSDAVIVTSSRVDIDNIASGDQVLDLDRYLEYWWNRILAGLGMSRVGFGQGNTANRNTAQIMAAEMQNTTIKFQQIIKDAVENYIIRELLLELGYTEETLTEENMVYLHIPEIDLENKIKKENHVLNLFLSNLLTFDEARNEIGRDTLSDKEVQRLFAFMFQAALTQLEVQAQLKARQNLSKNSDQPANQYGRQNARPKIAKDDLEEFYNNLRREVFLLDTKNAEGNFDITTTGI